MRVEHYSDEHFNAVMELIRDFHEKYLAEFYGECETVTITETISKFRGENSKNAFLLFADKELIGLLAGVPIDSKINNQRFFQEIFWYVKNPWGHYGFHLINQAKKMLKSYGFSNIIMSVLENPKAEKIEKIYERMKFRKLETHYLGDL